MSHRIPKTAAIVATAATAAFAAYAVGSQTNSGGTAGASGSAAAGYGYAPGPGARGPRDGREPFGRGPDLAALATKLGVSTTALKSALQSLRPDAAGHADVRDAMAQKLADALGVDKAKLTAALAKLRPDGRGRHDGPRDGAKGADTAFAAALAKELGQSTADVTAALTKLRADHDAAEKTERDAFAQKLADKLNISADKVKSVFAAGPFGGPGFHGPRHR
jgi:hypothetical protein